MECRICSSIINESPLLVKEMMFGTGLTYPYFKCPSCGCLQIEHPETNTENLYPASYYSFNTYNITSLTIKIKRMVVRYSVARELGHHYFFNFLFAKKDRDGGAHALKGRLSKTSKILDVGCGDGSLIDALDWCGYKNLTGIDPFLKQDISQPHYQLLKKSIDELEGSEVYDIIMLHHSFEHVENPLEVMHHIKRLLKKDGLCIIRIPVSDSYVFEKYRENWVQLDAPRHIFLHTNKSMELLASRNDLRIESIVDDSIEFQFLGSEQYKNGISLSDSRSYFVSPHKKFFFNKKHLFSPGDIKNFKAQATRLNKEGKGDQRIYYIINSSHP